MLSQAEIGQWRAAAAEKAYQGKLSAHQLHCDEAGNRLVPFAIEATHGRIHGDSDELLTDELATM